MNKYWALIIICSFLGANGLATTLFDKLESAISNSKTSYQELIEKYSKSNFRPNLIKDIQKVRLHPNFINMLMLYNKSRVLKLGLKDKCTIIDLLNTELLYDPSGDLSHVLIEFENKKNNIEIHALKKEDYLNIIGYEQCPNSKKLKLAFEPQNIRKTLGKTTFQYPRSKQECHEQYNTFINDPKTPYLCNVIERLNQLPTNQISLRNIKGSNYRDAKRIEQSVRKAQSYKKIINNDSIQYLNNMCENAAQADYVCHSMFEINFWTKASKTKKLHP